MMQRGVWSCLHPTTGRRYPNNDQMLQYKCMPDPVYDDTLKSGIVSTQENKYWQAYCFRYGWICFHPTAWKTEAYDTLSLMFNLDGVPPNMIVEKSKDKSVGAFAGKCRESEFHLVNSEPYSPWSHISEVCIWELKRGLSIQLIKTGFNKRLWDNCIELQALVNYHTAHSA